jgi:5'(3')-deoxyribonucleotidase
VANNDFVFGVDLDGVCADFYEGIRPIAAEWLGVPEDSLTRNVSYGLAEWGMDKAAGGYLDFHKFAVTQRELFMKLKPIQDAPQSLRRLSKAGVRIRIITHRLFIKYFHTPAVTQTIGWLDHHGIPYWDLCFMGEKTAVGADLYIDDAPSNIKRLREQACDVIVFANSTNHGLDPQRVSNWREVESLVLQKLEVWRSKNPQTAQKA